jgi:hypothetical protein
MEEVLVMALYAFTAFSPAPDPQAVRDAASDARVDETDLLGALLTVGETSPREYLYRTGELERPYTPQSYLYRTYPAIARRLDCVIARESRWSPSAQNPRSSAGGLAQILLSTWLSTPQGKRGESRFDAYSNIDGAAWLATSGGGWRHWAATVGGC